MTATLGAMLTAAAKRDPSATALVEREGDRTRILSYAELVRVSEDVAADLGARGVGAGDVVGVWMPTRVEAVAIDFALASLGAASLGISTRYGPDDVADLLARGRPVGVIVPEHFLGIDFAGRLEQAVERVGADALSPWVAVADDLGRAGDVVPARTTGRPSDVAKYFTTSGSTGHPKLAGHDQAAIVEHARNVARVLEMHRGDVMLGVLPLSGVFGFNPAMSILYAGGTLLLEPVFDAAAVVADMAELGVTHAIGGDDMLARLMRAWTSDPVPLPGFRRGGIADFAGGSAEIVTWAERELGARVSGVYGSSELFALVGIWPGELSLDERVRGGGRPTSDAIEVRVVDPETGERCRPDVVGELQFRGYTVLQRYLSDDGAWRAAFSADGWFRSGDLGSMTGVGADFVFVCRAGDALRLHGYLVEPAEIERFLLSDPRVEAAKVVGLRSERGGDRAVAYVTLRRGAALPPEQLLGTCREGLAGFKVPSAIEVLDEMPVTRGPNGMKIKTAELRQRAERLHQESA